MNKIFRIVWSQATQSWVVVSELTKAHKKQSSSNSQGSAVKFSGNFIKSSAIALTLLSGHSAYAVNDVGTGGAQSVAFGTQSNATGAGAVALGAETNATQNNTVAIGKKAQSTGDSAIALGFQSKSTSAQSVAVGMMANASKDQAVAVGSTSQATGVNSIAIGNAANASNEFSVALGSKTTSSNKYTTAVGGTAFANQEGATALGYGARATATNTIAIGKLAKAEQEGVLALGAAASAQGADTIAIGNSAAAKKAGDIIIGKEAKSRDQGGGRSVAIGFKAVAGSQKNNAETDDTSTGKRSDDGSVAIGTNAYTGLNKTNAAINSAVAIGAGAGAGYRSVGADGTPLGVGTDADDNATVLVKAFGGTTSTLGNYNTAGAASNPGFFSFQGVDINEGVALGRNTRAIGDQSVAIGAQSVAGQGSIVIGGNDIQAYDGKKYFKAAKPESAEAKGVNDYNAEVTPGTGKDGQPITISAKYQELVGVGLDRSYRASYGQDGSTVIGMQAHSTTPLGVAIGTNSIVRKGAFGATAIGSGASVVANAEAAVAIGMGAEAQGSYAVAAGTAARAKESAVAAGYSSKAEESAVAVGDHAEAVNASVAVGQLAKAKKVADIAVGQGAVASGEQGAIAVGLGTQAQGDSSIMIGGSEITKVANQRVTYQKENKDKSGHTVIKTTKKKEQIGGEEVERTIRSVEMVNATGTIQDAYGELTNGANLTTTTLDYSKADNKNGHGSISMGIHSLSTGHLGTAIGTGARVTQLGGVALGTGAISELQNGVAIGTGSKADKNSVGTRQTDISYDEEGKIVPFDSKKVAYTFYWAGGINTSEGDVVSFGTPGAERQLKNVAAGRIADDSTDAINGSQLNSVTKRMSSGWAVEAEKDHGSSGVLKLKGTEATGQSVNYATDGKSSTKGESGTATGHVNKVRLNDEVKIRVGDNLVLNQEDATRDAYEDPDNPNRKTGTHITSKFTYSLNPVLKKLESAEFKNTVGDTTVINGAGVTVTPVTTGKQPVSLTTTGLNNGGNAISNVAGNLPETNNNDATTGASNATTSQSAPTLGNAANQVNPTNAATVSDVLNAGWNLQGNNKAVDFVKAYDTVNFINGDGTTATVESTDGKTSTVKYSVNLGNGLEKDTNNNITVKAADKSLEVTNGGVKVKAADNTLTTDANGLKVNTGSITTAAVPTVTAGDENKIATVGNVAEAIKAAAWKATSDKTANGENTGKKDQEVKAGDTVTFEADKNIKIAQADGKFTFSTKDNVEFTTVKVGDTANGKKPVELKNGDVITTNNNSEQPTTALNVSSDNKPTQITGVGSVLNTEAVPTIPAGTATNTDQQPKLVNLGTAHGQTALSPNVLNSAATVRDLANMGWKVSSDKTTGADSKGYTDVVRNADEVKFVGKNAAKVSGKTVNGVRTITVDVEVPDVKTAELVSSKDGSVIAPSTNPELQKALKAAKDKLAALPNTATEAEKEAAKNEVKAAETALNNVLDDKGVATAKNVADMINASGFTLKTSATADGKKDDASTDAEVINPGKAVEMIAGKNLTVKQEANGKVTYATKDEVSFNTVQVGGSDGPKLTKTESGDLKLSDKDGTKPVAITNVKSNLPETKNGIPAEVTKAQPAPTLGTEANQVNASNAATVGDVLNAGWNLQNNGAARDFVKPYDTVNFVDGLNTKAVVTTDAEGKVSNVQIDIKDLPIAYTNEAGDKVVKAADGKYYKESDLAGKVYDPKTKQFKNADGTALDKQPTEVAGDTVKTNLVNPNAVVDKTATTDPSTLGNVKSGLDTIKEADNKAAAGLINLNEKDPLTNNKLKVSDNNAATVGDLRKMGWVVSSDKTTGGTGEYSDQVKNANEVRFVGKGTATVSGKTDDKGVRTITVEVNDQISTNNAVTPVVYTKADGTKVYPIKQADGTTKFFTNPDGTGDEVLNTDVITSVNGPEGTTSPTTLKNVKNNIPNVNDGSKTITTPDGKEKAGDVENINKAPLTAEEAAKLSNPKTKDGQTNPNYIGNNAATVSDVLNAGWNLQNNGAAKDFVKPFDTVNFVNGGNTTAVVTTAADGTTSDVTFNVTGLPIATTIATPNGPVQLTKVGDNYYPVKADGTPDIKTDADGNPTNGYVKADDGKYYPASDVTFAKDPNTQVTKVTPKDGKEPVTFGNSLTNPNVVNTADAPNKSVAAPTTLNNVKSNLPTVNDANKNASDVDGNPIDGKNNKAAPITAADAADLLNPIKDGKPNPNFAGNNAATVSDVLNAGWNLQNNGTAKDFVKPYDTVNFVDGANTTAVVTTSEDGTTSNVTYNVTGLPVTFTDKDGKPVSKIGDKYYPVNEKGQPVSEAGNPAVGTNNDGDLVDKDGNVIKPIDTAANPLKSNLVNPNVANSKEAPNNQTKSPTQLGNVANGANTFDPVDGKKMANDGKWYPANEVEPNGQPKTGATPVEVPANIGKAGLINFSKSNPNNAATVGDLQNLGWIVSASGNNYSDQVRNANEVKFVGEGTATVTGKTDDKGVRTITVKVDDQVSTNNAQTPVNYTNKDGKKVYPVKDENGNVTYHTTPDGKGTGDETVPAGDVITSLNGPEGTTTPTTLNNVKNNIPAVNDVDKKVTNSDGTEKGTAGDVNNINKAPLTATEAADLLNPTKDGKPNPNFAGNNAATVSDVLNAGWNLQNNGEARDFVKPFDTVNFVNGANTTAVVTTNAEGTASDVTYNVTGLPITYTTADGKPVSKVGDKYYPVNEKGQPIGPDGKPAVTTNADGKPVTEDGTVIEPIDTAKDPLKSNLVNPNVSNTADAPNKQTTTPTQLGNVANGAETFKPADVKLANDGKWYPADQVEPNGKPKDGAKSVASPLVTKNAAGDVLEKGSNGNWYKADDLVNGEPKPNVDEQTPVAKPENADKAGLINFENSNPNNAATVGDLQNMGFVVSAKDNGYTEQMRNANKVEFKGDNGVQVTGKTLADGTREITVALKEGRVTNDVLITDKDGKVTHGVRGEDGKIYTKDPKTGKATKEEIPVKPSDTVENDGNAYVTGNSVATAIQKSGWNIGIGSTDKAFSEEAKTYERVNPKDNVKYVNGANTTVSMAVDAAEDKNGDTVTTTYVKVDVNRDLHIDSVTTGGPAKDKAGNPLKQINGEYYPENALVNDGKVYPAGTVIIDGKPYPAGSTKDPKTNEIVKDGKPAPEAQPLTATPKDQLADGKDGAMTVKDAKGNDGVSATAKDGKGTLTLKDAGKDGKDASQVDISTAKAPADLENTPKDAVRANDGNWYTPADVTVEVKDGKTVVTPKAGKTPIPNAPTMDRIQYTGTDGKPRNVATMDDGLRFVGDDGETISKPLNSTMEFTGGNRENGKPVAKADTTTGNIGVFHDNGKLSVQLAKDLEKMNSANFETPDGTSTKITGNGLSVTPETAKLKDPKTGKPILDKDGNPKVDPKKVVSFGGPTIMKDPKTGKPVVDSKTGKPVMESGISAGGQVMTNVAPGRISPTSTDAVNGSQLHAVASNLNNKINKVGKHADAGTASALAASNIPQAYTPGKSLVGIAAGSYQGQTGVAVGMSRISDNGKIIIRLSGTTNTQGRAGVAAGVGYQW